MASAINDPIILATLLKNNSCVYSESARNVIRPKPPPTKKKENITPKNMLPKIIDPESGAMRYFWNDFSSDNDGITPDLSCNIVIIVEGM
mmetsp:Transcript_26468/g.32025  ORF Transcript_26468/g.32025 Transcript_26468/m.32025 type:complete len:90 (-) Transcript_26468:544-813(-)